MRISLPSGTTAELARPDGAPSIGLVLIPDILGLRPLFDEHCARLARENGWVVCAFELFAGREHLTRDERMVAARDNDDTRILGDAVAAARATGCERVNLIGFCMGGMYALKSVRTGRFARPGPTEGTHDRHRRGHARPRRAGRDELVAAATAAADRIRLTEGCGRPGRSDRTHLLGCQREQAGEDHEQQELLHSGGS